MGKSQADLDNHANQMNPNNDAYWESRGYDERPEDWEEEAAAGSGFGTTRKAAPHSISISLVKRPRSNP